MLLNKDGCNFISTVVVSTCGAFAMVAGNIFIEKAIHFFFHFYGQLFQLGKAIFFDKVTFSYIEKKGRRNT